MRRKKKADQIKTPKCVKPLKRIIIMMENDPISDAPVKYVVKEEKGKVNLLDSEGTRQGQRTRCAFLLESFDKTKWTIAGFKTVANISEVYVTATEESAKICEPILVYISCGRNKDGYLVYEFSRRVN